MAKDFIYLFWPDKAKDIDFRSSRFLQQEMLKAWDFFVIAKEYLTAESELKLIENRLDMLEHALSRWPNGVSDATLANQYKLCPETLFSGLAN